MCTHYLHGYVYVHTSTRNMCVCVCVCVFVVLFFFFFSVTKGVAKQQKGRLPAHFVLASPL